LRWHVSFISGKPYGRTAGGPSPIELDDEFGWRATENFEKTLAASDGGAHGAPFSQDAQGFRMFGDLNSSKPKIFVIGDSFTQAVDASDDKTYYAVIREHLPVEIFATGTGGYGSLQESMVLDKYLDVIKPDLILWQFTTNDIVNNSPELEAASHINNNGMIRPYWVNGNVSYILPRLDAMGLRFFAFQYCRTCYFLMTRIDRLRAAPGDTVEIRTSPGEEAHATFREALHVTDAVMAQVRRRAGRIPIVAFIAGTAERRSGPEYEEGLEEVSRKNGIIVLRGIEAAVTAAENQGVRTKAEDGAHWNETGHRIVGEGLADGLKQYLPESLKERLSSGPVGSQRWINRMVETPLRAGLHF
jgi:lysophospholipase L1-like esterase